MFSQFYLFTSVLACAAVSVSIALPYGLPSIGGGYGLSAIPAMLPVSSGYGGGYGGGGGGYGYAVPAAVISNHHVNFYDVPSTGYVKPTTIDVPANILPVNFVFRSASSMINVESKHQGATGAYKETQSQDEPHKLVHTVTKPIIQEVREIISPFRKIVQTVEPVREEIKTLVARGYGGGYGGGMGGGAPIMGEPVAMTKTENLYAQQQQLAPMGLEKGPSYTEKAPLMPTELSKPVGLVPKIY